MTSDSLLALVLLDSARINTAIGNSCGCGATDNWVPWMQVELLVLLRQTAYQAVTGNAYPAPNASQSLSALACDAVGQYAIQLTVEAPPNTGAALLTAATSAIGVLATYPNVSVRWVLAIAYSVDAKAALLKYSATKTNNANYKEVSGLGCMVITVAAAAQ